MSRVIHKFIIIRGYNEITIPVGAKFLRFDFQEDIPTMWFEVNVSAALVHRRFQIYATGEPIPRRDLEYRQTAFQGPLVWHLYELVSA